MLIEGEGAESTGGEASESTTAADPASGVEDTTGGENETVYADGESNTEQHESTRDQQIDALREMFGNTEQQSDSVSRETKDASNEGEKQEAADEQKAADDDEKADKVDDKPKEDENKNEPPPEDPYHKKFLKLATREKKVTEREAQIREVEKKLQPVFAAIQAGDAKALLDAAGFTFQQVVEAGLKDGEQPSLEDQIKALQQELAEVKGEGPKKEREQKQREADKILSDFKLDIKDYLESKPDDFELTLAHFDNPAEAANEVYELIERVYEQSAGKTTLSLEEAARMIEKNFEEQAEKIFKAKKFASKSGVDGRQGAAASASKAASQTGQQSSPRTLSSEVVNTPAAKPDSYNGSYFDDEEARERAKRILLEG